MVRVETGYEARRRRLNAAPNTRIADHNIPRGAVGVA